MRSPESQIYRFEDVEVDAFRGRLKCGGEERHLRQKAFSVLVYLVEQRARVITKDELMAEVWRDTAVTDDALVQCIRDIRRALDDDSHRPRFIRTIPKVGYHFIGPVVQIVNHSVTTHVEEITRVELEIEESESEAANGREPGEVVLSPNTSSISASSRLRVFRSRRLILTAAVVLISAVALFVYFSPNLFKSQTEEISLSPVPGKKLVVVMYFDNQSGDAELDWLRGGLTEMLIANLSRSDKLNVLSRNRFHLLLERVTGKAGENIQSHEAVEIARKAQAESFITGSFARIGEKVRLDAQIYDGQNGDLRASETLTVEKADQILTEIDLLSLRLLARLGVVPNQEQTNLNLSQAMTDNLQAYRYYSLALEKAQAMHNGEAIDLLGKAIALDPQFAMAYARIGYTYTVTWGYGDKGKPFLEKAFQLSHRLSEKDRLYITAWYAIANLDYANAINAFKRVVSQYPLEVEAYERLGRLLAGEGQVEEAIEVFKRGLLIDREAKDIYNTLGGAYSILGKHDEAIAMHRQYVELAPLEANAHDSLGLSYLWAGRYQEAIAEYERALERNPRFEVAIIHLGNAYFQQGRYQDAIDQYRRYIEVAPLAGERVRGFDDLARVYLREGDLGQAMVWGQKTLRHPTYRAVAPILLALEQSNQSRAEQLMSAYATVTSFVSRGTRPAQRYIYYLEGCIALRNGRQTEAIEDFKQAVQQAPPTFDIDAFEDCLANAYLELGRFDEAIIEYKRILALNPNYPLAHYYLAQAFEGKSQHDEAVIHYKKFLEVWKNADSNIREVIHAKKVSGLY